jgi:eukaryotic-like serine/threonine-protein kinase
VRIGLAMILRRLAEPDAAAEQVIGAADLLLGCPSDRTMALAVLSAVRLDQGRSAEALAFAREAYPATQRAPAYTSALIRLARAEALAATDEAAAVAAFTEARDELLAQAARIGDPALRASFLERVPQNVRTLALAPRLPLDGAS